MYLVYSTQQLMLLISVCIQANSSTGIYDLALTYTTRLLETTHLQVFRKIAKGVVFEQYANLLYFNGMLSFLVPALLRNGLIIKILKSLTKTVGKLHETKGDPRKLAELLFVQSVMRRLD